MIDTTPNCIMNNAQAKEKLHRMGLQIQEDAIDGTNIVLVGLNSRGFFIAKLLHKILLDALPNNIFLINLTINNSNAMLPHSMGNNVLYNQQVIIIDDVANTGRSFAYAMYALLPSNCLSIKTLALVERSHKLFPIKVNYKGLSISTTLQERIEMKIGNNEEITVNLY